MANAGTDTTICCPTAEQVMFKWGIDFYQKVSIGFLVTSPWDY